MSIQKPVQQTNRGLQNHKHVNHPTEEPNSGTILLTRRIHVLVLILIPTPLPSREGGTPLGHAASNYYRRLHRHHHHRLMKKEKKEEGGREEERH